MVFRPIMSNSIDTIGFFVNTTVHYRGRPTGRFPAIPTALPEPLSNTPLQRPTSYSKALFVQAGWAGRGPSRGFVACRTESEPCQKRAKTSGVFFRRHHSEPISVSLLGSFAGRETRSKKSRAETPGIRWSSATLARANGGAISLRSAATSSARIVVSLSSIPPRKNAAFVPSSIRPMVSRIGASGSAAATSARLLAAAGTSKRYSSGRVIIRASLPVFAGNESRSGAEPTDQL